MSVFYDEGNYTGRITHQAMTKASTGTPQFVLKVQVLKFSDGTSVPKQYERTIYRSITEKTVDYVQKDFDALGFTGTSLKQLDPSDPNFQDFTGNEIEVYCKHEDSRYGELREKWAISSGSASKAIEGTPVEAATYRKLDALFGLGKRTATPPPPAPARRAAVNEVEGAEMASNHGPAGAFVTDEDIPF